MEDRTGMIITSLLSELPSNLPTLPTSFVVSSGLPTTATYLLLFHLPTLLPDNHLLPSSSRLLPSYFPICTSPADVLPTLPTLLHINVIPSPPTQSSNLSF